MNMKLLMRITDTGTVNQHIIITNCKHIFPSEFIMLYSGTELQQFTIKTTIYIYNNN